MAYRSCGCGSGGVVTDREVLSGVGGSEVPDCSDCASGADLLPNEMCSSCGRRYGGEAIKADVKRLLDAYEARGKLNYRWHGDAIKRVREWLDA